jgi:hypothetical protein
MDMKSLKKTTALFNAVHPSIRTMAPGLTQPLTEMSTGNVKKM